MGGIYEIVSNRRLNKTKIKKMAVLLCIVPGLRVGVIDVLPLDEGSQFIV